MVVGVVVLGGSGKEKGDGWVVRGVQREAKPTIYKEEEAVRRGIYPPGDRRWLDRGAWRPVSGEVTTRAEGGRGRRQQLLGPVVSSAPSSEVEGRRRPAMAVAHR
jgi:hypothetical protein